MQIVEKRLDELQPYENNPRKNDNAVPYVAESIRQYGFKVPIVIDKDGVIVAGHTRYLAAQELEMETVPCIVADDLTEEQIREFRLVDNKVAEYSGWDFEALKEELGEIKADLSVFGFNVQSELEEVNELKDELFDDEPVLFTCPHCGEQFEVVDGEAVPCR